MTTLAPSDSQVLDLLEQAGIDLTDIRRIPLAEIKPGSFQPRKHFDQKALEELAANIRRNGQTEPGILNEMDDGSFELIAGERRWRALQMLSRATFRGVVVRIRDRKLLARLALSSNGPREDLSALEVLEACLEMRSEMGMDDAEIAESWGQTVQWVSNTFSLDRLHGKLRPLLGSKERGGFSRSVGLELIRLAPSEQMSAMRRIRKGGLGQKRTRRIVEEMLADGAAPHPAAQDRRAPTDAFLKVVHGGVQSAVESLTKLTTAARRKKLGELKVQDAAALRQKVERARKALDTLEEALPAGS